MVTTGSIDINLIALQKQTHLLDYSSVDNLINHQTNAKKHLRLII